MQKFDVIAKRCKPLVLLSNNDILGYSKGWLVLINSITGVKKRICNLPMSLLKRFLSNIRLCERLLRLEPRTAVLLNNHTVLLSFQGCMYRVDLTMGTVELEHRFRKGVNNPLSICYITGIEGFSDCVVYGEYKGNPDTDCVCIYRRGIRIDDKWEKVWEFPGNSIAHIHSIVPDPYRNGVLVLTGDEDSESGIWLARNNFEEMQPLLVGKQQYRTCCAYPLEEGILYATDTPMENNHISIIKLKKTGWVSEKLKEINGSCIYSTQWKNQYVFSTAVEPYGTVKDRRYLFTSKRGKGIKSDCVDVLIGDINSGFRCLAKFKKDIWPMGLFQLGVVQFVNNSDADAMYLYPVAVQKYDNRLIVYRKA